MRAAIEAGEDVNQFDTEPHMGYNEGRPLDACLNASHMPGGADIRDNLPLIELLLEHGADPRLCVWTGSVTRPPIWLAKYNADNTTDPEMKVFWDRVIELFNQAVEKLEKQGQGLEQVRKINEEGREAMRQLFESKEDKA